MEIINPEHTTKISEFYKEKHVFITGATGFLGKALIEKLLRCCLDIGNVYILVRPKKGKDLKERVNEMLKDLIFDTLKQTAPSQLSKLIPLRGDCSQLNLGLDEADYQTITSSVSVIYHLAASVSFNDTLKYATLLNTRGTRELALLALQTSRLSVLVHVSTTYCNCVLGKELKEQMYPAPDDWRKMVKIAEEMDEGHLVVLQDKYLGPYPNTYTFTKALAEHVIKDLCEGRIPTIICRPSVVVSTLRDPVKGWIDNFNGPLGLLVACGKGVLRCCYVDYDIYLDHVPLDSVVKGIIAASWDLGLKQQRNKLEVMHCSSGHLKWITFGKMASLGKELCYEIPLNNAIWVPKVSTSRCHVYVYLCTILFHLLPACFLDLGLKIAGKKPMVMRLQTKIYNAGLQLRYFMFQEWNFCNTNFITLGQQIIEEDRETWRYDIIPENVHEYISDSLLGIRRYLLHENDESLPQARIHYNRMYWLDKITMFILYGSLFWLVIQLGLIDFIFCKICNSVTYYSGRIGAK